VRVVAGIVKGRELSAPRTTKTRPTSDKVRDAIFNVVGAATVGARVLDLYAGSGAMAIEALSRGADRADLVESDRDACAAIRGNLDLTGFTDCSTIWPIPVEGALSRLDSPFDLVLVDPPYEHAGIQALMESLGLGALLSKDGIVVLEHGKRVETRPVYGKLKRWREKRYGDTAVSFFEMNVSD